MKPLIEPKGIVIHHSLTKDGTVEDWAAIDRYHREVKGWEMCGYHGGLERINGTIYHLTGRPINREGAHTVGHNDMLGLCIVGNFDAVPPDDEILLQASYHVRAWLNMFPHLSPKDVHRHHEYAEKSCPGKLFPWETFLALVTVA